VALLDPEADWFRTWMVRHLLFPLIQSYPFLFSFSMQLIVELMYYVL
jgi:hypothetical protein